MLIPIKNKTVQAQIKKENVREQKTSSMKLHVIRKCTQKLFYILHDNFVERLKNTNRKAYIVKNAKQEMFSSRISTSQYGNISNTHLLNISPQQKKYLKTQGTICVGQGWKKYRKSVFFLRSNVLS